MGQVEDTLKMTNQEAANILRRYMGYIITGYGRGSGKTGMQIRQLQALRRQLSYWRILRTSQI